MVNLKAFRMDNEKKVTLVYQPKIWAALAFCFLIVLNNWLFFGRKIKFLKIAFFENTFPEFYTHISNFTILSSLLILTGFVWLILGVPLKYVILLGGCMILFNFIYELFIPVINIRDIVDAWYGLAGGITGLIFLVAVRKWGLKKVNRKLQ